MIILTIDPGSLIIGYAVFDTEGSKLQLASLRRVKGKSFERRLQTLSKEIKTLVSEHKPDLVIVEDTRFSKYAKNIGMLGKTKMAIGAVVAALDEAPLIEFVFANQVRAAIKSPNKAATEGRVKVFFPDYVWRETKKDVFDATAIGIYYFIKNGQIRN